MFLSLNNVLIFTTLLLLIQILQVYSQSTIISTSSSNIKTTSSSNKQKQKLVNVNVGIILPIDDDRPFAIQKCVPSIYEAFISNRVRNLLPNCNITLFINNSRCNSIAAPLAAFDMIEVDKVQVFFGPVCDYSLAPVARYSPSWDIPVISPGGISSDFEVKTSRSSEFPLLTRMGITSEDLAVVVEKILDNFKWKAVKVLYSLDGHSELARRLCGVTMSALLSHLELVGVEADGFSFEQKEEEEDIINMLTTEIGNLYAINLLCNSPDSIRALMIKVAEMGYANGEYVFINFDLYSSKENLQNPWYDPDDTDERNRLARCGFETLLTFTWKQPEGPEFRKFSDNIKVDANMLYNELVFQPDEEVNVFVVAFYDAALLYAHALNETMQAGLGPSNGTYITKKMWNRTINGITGQVKIDDNGDRISDYSLLDMNPETGLFEVVGSYYGYRRKFELTKQIHWGGYNPFEQPPDVLKCGHNFDLCPEIITFTVFKIVFISLLIIFLIVLLISLFCYRDYAQKKKKVDSDWRIKWDDILFESHDRRKWDHRHSIYGSTVSINSVDSSTHHSSEDVFIKTGIYKGISVAIQKINRPFNLSKQLEADLKTKKNLHEDHIVRFFGLCVDPPNACIVTEYCHKRTLKSLLKNDQINLDMMFKYSLIQDIIFGMAYLHSSEIQSHGNLNTLNCLVDGKFVLKINNFGLHSLRDKPKDYYVYDEYPSGHESNFQSLLWTAPELLRDPCRPPGGTQKGDMYSFAIICQEILYRKGPFWIENSNLETFEILNHVKKGKLPYCRPTLYLNNQTNNSPSLYNANQLDNQKFISSIININNNPANSYNQNNNNKIVSNNANIGTSIGTASSSLTEIVHMISKCWSESPYIRPDFNNLKWQLRRNSGTGKDTGGGSLLDNLLSRLEQYAQNLELMVEEKTHDYLEQRRKAEEILHMLLPRSVAQQLMYGGSVKAEKFECVTICFCDICGFTALSASSSPMEIITMLNELYTKFDDIIDTFDVYKVETIGDAYMVVSGLPITNNDSLHAAEIARMSIVLLEAVKSFKIAHRPKENLLLRTGIHSGPVCAGVVGMKMPRYCLFGDTVNTTCSIQTLAEPSRIHVSQQTKDILDFFKDFDLVERGKVELPGKGLVPTYWLLGLLTNKRITWTIDGSDLT